ncbi:MAG: thermonuclease family protein [Acidimicrobiia bacterium]
MMRSWWMWAVMAGIMMLVTMSSGGCTPSMTGRESVRVVEVVDGDTLVVRVSSGAQVHVRILGVDTPETKKPSVPVQCFGPEAEAYTRALLAGTTVTLIADVETQDRYGRRLAYVEYRGRDVGHTLLAEGYARFLVIAPNGRRARKYLSAELAARRAQRGLWGACEAQ